MRKHIITIAIAFLMVLPMVSPASETPSRCQETDKVCRQFEALLEEQQPEKVISLYSVDRQYSEDARRLVGEAYLALASQDNISAELEEGYYRKAIEVKHNIAYMGLYFFYASKDEEKAVGFLKDYVRTRPADTVPYVILGEYELNKKNYDLADTYLRLAKQVAHAHSPRVDWLLFQTNYILANYTYAKEMFESAVSNGKFENEIKALVMDPRFADISRRPEFMKYQNLLKVAKI